jgi:chromosomal replication initiator protein
VITADRSPQNLEGIQDRILSRMAWGLVADINPADYELRYNILHAKVAGLARRVAVPDDVIEFLARKITTNVRELEGALNRVTAFAPAGEQADHAGIHPRDAGRHAARPGKEADHRRDPAQGRRLLWPQGADLLSERRAREVARPRQIAMYLAKKMTPRSLPEIGRRFGKRDHTTVMHAVKKVEQLRAEDREIDSDVATLARLLDG